MDLQTMLLLYLPECSMQEHGRRRMMSRLGGRGVPKIESWVKGDHISPEVAGTDVTPLSLSLSAPDRHRALQKLLSLNQCAMDFLSRSIFWECSNVLCKA